jgi:ubiquinone/menaquinone biosynthesis C-methylase UbiE
MNKTLTEKDAAYWDSVYRIGNVPTNESHFARCVLNKIKYNQVILDLGCGNGRDSAYFSNHKHTVLSLDNSHEALKKAQELSNNKIVPILADASKMSITSPFVDVVYSRFSLHSMDRDSYLKCIKNMWDCLKWEGSFFIEVRSVKDELFEEGEKVDKDTYTTDHSRRFFDIKTLVDDLESLGFVVEFAEENKGWAVYKGSDPKVIRVYCRK